MRRILNDHSASNTRALRTFWGVNGMIFYCKSRSRSGMRISISALFLAGVSCVSYAQESGVSDFQELAKHETIVKVGNDPDNFGFALSIALARLSPNNREKLGDDDIDILRSLEQETTKSNIPIIYGPYAERISEALGSPSPNVFYVAELITEARSKERQFRTKSAREAIVKLSPASQKLVASLVEQEMATLKWSEHDLYQLAVDNPDVVLEIGLRISEGVKRYSNFKPKKRAPVLTQHGSWGVIGQ